MVQPPMIIVKSAYLVAVSILLCSWNFSQQALAPSQQALRATAVHGLRVVLRVDEKKYSVKESVEMEVFLRNDNGPTIYIDKRLFWGGLGSSLSIVVTDRDGNPVKGRMFADVPIPPPSLETRLLSFPLMQATRTVSLLAPQQRTSYRVRATS
jgi:hypothetical protein